MPESIRKRYTRKNLVIDAALHRAIEGLYELYYEYLREHPDIAEDLEDLMYDIADCRTKLRRFHIRCWETDPPQMRDSRNIELLIREAKRDCVEKVAICQDSFRHWDRSGNELSALLKALVAQLEKQSERSCPSLLPSAKPELCEIGRQSRGPQDS